MKSDGPIPEPLKGDVPEALSLTEEEKAERVARFRTILASKQLTVYSVMKKTKQLYGASSDYFIEHNFSHYIVSRAVSPHVCQVVALSRLTGYSLADWLEFFGFPPRIVSDWQWKLHSDRTTLLPSEIDDRNALVPFLGTQLRAEELDSTVPLSRIAQYSKALSAGKIESLNSQGFLYARIGKQDALGFPDLVPGSIVRIDPRRTSVETEIPPPGTARPLYLVEHREGLSCCHVQSIERNTILLAPHLLELERLRFTLGQDAVILGTINAEIRPLIGVENPTGHRLWRDLSAHGLRRTIKRASSIDELLRLSRERMGLNYRKAHELTLQLAAGLNNYQYQLAASWLHEIEKKHVLPRRIEKIFSLCMVYCLGLWNYLQVGGLSLEETGREPFPLQYRTNAKLHPISPAEQRTFQGPTLADHLAMIIEETPQFLRHRFPFYFGQQEITSRELYWFGLREKVFHPVLKGAVLLAVDAATVGDRGLSNRWKDPWERPIYLVMQRNGKYLCGFCVFNGNSITVVPHPDSSEEPVHFTSSMEAEVVGRVVAVARVFR